MNELLYNLPDDDYRKLGGVSKSFLWELRKSPAHALSYANKPKTQAMSMGSAFDDLIFTGVDGWDARWGIGPTKTRTAKAFIEAEANLAEGVLGLLTEEEKSDCLSMREALLGNPHAAPLLKASKYQVSFRWGYQPAGLDVEIVCKGRADAVGKHAVIDLKTARDATYAGFRKDSLKFGYPLQALMYMDGLRANGVDLKEFILCVVGKQGDRIEPFPVRCYRYTRKQVEECRPMLDSLLRKYYECSTSNKWNPPQVGIMDLDIPEYFLEGYEDQSEEETDELDDIMF